MQPKMFGAPPPLDRSTGPTLVSKSDLQGRITYANEAYVQASGFALQELVGHSYEILRHPDVPSVVFAQMWQTLQSGAPWQGVLQNRSKNGDSLWIQACIVPIQRNEQVTGYMAVCQLAEPTVIAAAQSSYLQLASQRQPKSHQLIPALGVRASMRVGFAAVALLVLAGGILGIGGLKLSDAAFTRVFQDQFEPAAAVSQIEARLGDVRGSLLELQLRSEAGAQAERHRRAMDDLHNAFDEIQETFERVTVSREGNTSATVALTEALRQYTTEGRSLLHSAAPNDTDALATDRLQQLSELQNKASLSAHALREALTQTAQQEFTETLQRNAHIRNLAIIGIVLGLLLVATTGRRFARSIVEPLNAAIQRLNQIAEGNLQGSIQLSGTGETAQLNQAALVMQQHLKAMLDEISLAARHIQQHCQSLHHSLHEVTEHSEAQHDQIHAALRALNTAVEETSDLSLRAERLMQMASNANPANGSEALEHETRELATATRFAVFGAEGVVNAMRQVADLIVENRSEAQLAWQASEELMRTANELNRLVDFFVPQPPAPVPAQGSTTPAKDLAPQSVV